MLIDKYLNNEITLCDYLNHLLLPMTENKQFWNQVEKEESALDIFRERNAKRRYKADPIRCDNCGTGIVIGEKCTSCGNLND